MNAQSRYTTTSRKVTGSTTGVCVTMADGALAINISNSDTFLTNSVTPGDEIQVGTGASVNAFSDLPMTDISTLCRAT